MMINSYELDGLLQNITNRNEMKKFSFILLGLGLLLGSCVTNNKNKPLELVSIRNFGVQPGNDADVNAVNLQKAIDWATERGAALYVEPSEKPYPVNGGIILKKNVSLKGVHGPTPRGTTHPSKNHPVGSVFEITDRERVFLTVETGTQVKGIQFWYPEQTLKNPEEIIPYPATIQTSKTSSTQGVYLSCLTFYGEYLAMDFNASKENICESMIFEHCYGYPLSGEFIRIDYCYDIPRIIHCHINPANQRYIRGGFSRAVIDSVIGKGTFAYAINHTDNAQMMDVFTFGSYGGMHIGEESYGQLTNFNFDCVKIGILKRGSNTFNRNWQIAQGSIIANAGTRVQDIHPIVISGEGHTSLVNVEAFSGDNGAVTNVGESQDYLFIEGDQKLTVSMFGCRMRNYAADEPLTIKNNEAIVQAFACIDKNEAPYNKTINP